MPGIERVLSRVSTPGRDEELGGGSLEVPQRLTRSTRQIQSGSDTAQAVQLGQKCTSLAVQQTSMAIRS